MKGFKVSSSWSQNQQIAKEEEKINVKGPDIKFFLDLRLGMKLRNDDLVEQYGHYFFSPQSSFDGNEAIKVIEHRALKWWRKKKELSFFR